MAKQDMSELGFGKESDTEASGEKVTERIDNRSWQLPGIEEIVVEEILLLMLIVLAYVLTDWYSLLWN